MFRKWSRKTFGHQELIGNLPGVGTNRALHARPCALREGRIRRIRRGAQDLSASLIREATEEVFWGKPGSWLEQGPTEVRVDREITSYAATSLEGKWRGAADA
jgi:hypothetical protein